MPDTASTLDIIQQALKGSALPLGGAAPASDFDHKLDMLKAGAAGKPLPKDITGTPYVGDDIVDPNGINITIRPKQRIPAGTMVGTTPPPEANGPTVGSVMASGTEAGLGGLAGTPVDLVQSIGNAGIYAYNKIRDQFTPDPNSLFTKPDTSKHAPFIPALPGGSDYIFKKMEEHGLKPRPDLDKTWQKYLYAATAGASGTLPTMLIPGMGPLKLGRALADTAVGAASGAGSEAGQEMAHAIDPNNPGLQTAAGLMAGLVPGGSKTVFSGAVRPFTKGGREVIAGQILNKEGRGATVAPPTGLPAGFKPTVGQATNAPGMIRLERTLEQNPEVGPDFQIQQQANQQVLRDNLDTLRSGQSSDDASVAMDQGMRAYKKAFKDQEKRLWDAIDPTNTAPQVTGIYRTRLATAIAKEPVAYQKLIPTSYADDLARLPPNASVKELHAILSQMKEDARVAGYAGEANKARAIGNVVKMFEKELTNQMLRANPAVRARFRAANAVSRNNAETYKQNPIGNVLAKDGSGAPRVQPTATASKLLGPGAGQKERWDAFKKAVNNNPQAIAVARDWFANKLIDAVLTSENTVSPANFEKFMKANAGLMASDIFNPTQKALIARINKAAHMAQNTAKGGVKGGSDTAAKLLGDKYVDVLIGKWAGKAIHLAGAGVGAAVGHTLGTAGAGEAGGLYAGFQGAKMLSNAMDKIYDAPAKKVRELLKDALLDPALAHDLMQKANSATPLPKTLARYVLADVAQNQSGALPAAR